MKLIMFWQQNSWMVQFEEPGISIPLPFLDFFRALNDLKRLYPDADIVVDNTKLRCGTRPEPPSQIS